MFREFAKDFFIAEKCLWTKRKMLKAKKNERQHFNSAYLPANRAYLKNYLLPQFGSVQLNLITSKMIDQWLMDLDSVQSGLPLSTSSLDKILNTMRRIMGEAEYQGHVRENVAAKVEPYESWTGHRREPFTMEEIQVLFPSAILSIQKIWSTLEVKELKTGKKGMTVKPIVFSDQLEEALTMLEFRGAPKDDLLFHSINGKPIIAETSNKHFKASAKRAGVERAGRMQYSLRHTFYTEMLKRIPEKDVQKMAGVTPHIVLS